MQRIKFFGAFSVRKVAPWRNSLLEKFGTSILYCLSFTPKTVIWKLQCLRVNPEANTCSYWWKPNTNFPSCGSRWSLVMVMICLHSSSHIDSLIRCLEMLVLSWVERVAVRKSFVWPQNFAPCYINKWTQWLLWNISVTIAYLTSDWQTSHIVTPFNIMNEARMSEKPTKLCVSAEINWKQG